MGIVTSKKLEESLEQARGLGLVEETFSIMDCEVTLRNLRPDEYEAVLDECAELEDMKYLNHFQKAHICRAIQEINGVSLRDVDFVECEEPDAKKPGQMRTVKRERHEWVRQKVLGTWGKEVVYTAYRKFSDVVVLAESRAKDGVTFMTPDETAEERYRRLLGEIKELEGEVAPALVTAILQDNGYNHFTQNEDREVADKILESEPEQVATVAETAPEPVVATPAPVQRVTEDLLRRRVPLNQVAESIPQPAAMAQSTTPTPVPPAAARRSAQLMALESEFDHTLKPVVAPEVKAIAPELLADPQMLEQPIPEAVELRPQGLTDPKAFGGIVERPPTAGLNPKFKPRV